ncbi:MAG: hypothetical protein Q7S64_02985 [bacterium]|nr:hypothetical protein [bacterium]
MKKSTMQELMKECNKKLAILALVPVISGTIQSALPRNYKEQAVIPISSVVAHWSANSDLAYLSPSIIWPAYSTENDDPPTRQYSMMNNPVVNQTMTSAATTQYFYRGQPKDLNPGGIPMEIV